MEDQDATSHGPQWLSIRWAPHRKLTALHTTTVMQHKEGSGRFISPPWF